MPKKKRVKSHENTLTSGKNYRVTVKKSPTAGNAMP